MLEARALGLRYGRRRALTDCALTIPAGRVTGLVGPNGAGKSTLLELACGLLSPTSGRIRVLGGTPGSGPGQLARVGFVAQDAPCTRPCPSPTTCDSAHTSTRAGTGARRIRPRLSSGTAWWFWRARGCARVRGRLRGRRGVS
jgi:ABC-type Mn2+/Zn2+ transport system ATPase subunit